MTRYLSSVCTPVVPPSNNAGPSSGKDKRSLVATAARRLHGCPWSLIDLAKPFNSCKGNIDFAALFQRLESSGYPYHSMIAFDPLEDKLTGCDRLTTCWRSVC